MRAHAAQAGAELEVREVRRTTIGADGGVAPGSFECGTAARCARGTCVAAVRENDTCVTAIVDAATLRPLRELARRPAGTGFCWIALSPDGATVAAVNADRVEQIDAASGRVVRSDATGMFTQFVAFGRTSAETFVTGALDLEMGPWVVARVRPGGKPEVLWKSKQWTHRPRVTSTGRILFQRREVVRSLWALDPR
jgi:hypothetical protein